LQTELWSSHSAAFGISGCSRQNFQPLVALKLEPLKLADKLACRERFRPFVPVTQNHL